MTPDAASILRKAPLFAPLPAAELVSLLENHHSIELAAGQELFREGQDADHLYVVVSGEICQPPGAGGGPARIAPGDTIGEEAALTATPYGTTAIATQPSSVIAIPVATLILYLDRHFDSAIAMISHMAAQLRDRVREITELKMQSTAERLASFLLSLAGESMGRVVVRLPYEKRLLADHLGMDPATLSRAFAKLREQGVVASRTDKVEIEDVARLRNYGNCAAFTP